MKKALFLLLCSASFHVCRAQDFPQFTQFYQNLPYLNPALVATGGDEWAFSTNQRNQWGWGSIGRGYRTSGFAAEWASRKTGWGAGLMLIHDVSGNSRFIQDWISPSVSYMERISHRSVMSFGLSTDIRLLSLHGDHLMIDDVNNGNIQTSSGRGYNHISNVINFSTGVSFMTPNFMLGLSIRDLLGKRFLPDGDFTSPNRNTHFGLISLHSSLTLPLSPVIIDHRITNAVFFRNSLFFYSNYRQQSLITQYELGMSLKHNVVNESKPSVKTNLTLFTGASYRSYFRETRNEKRDAIALVFGLNKYITDYQILTVNVSYDLTVSELAGRTGGAFELSVSLNLAGREWEAVKSGYDNHSKGSNFEQSPRRYFFSSRPSRECPYSSKIVPYGPDFVISKVAKLIRKRQHERTHKQNLRIQKGKQPR